MAGPLPIKRSVALLIRHGDTFLSTRRPDNDDEFPGIWGLPAGTYRESETLEDLVRRIGRDKLDVTLTSLRKLAEGTQTREGYILKMELWEAEMSGEPRHPQWKWTTADTLEPGREQGSLCCRLAIEAIRN